MVSSSNFKPNKMVRNNYYSFLAWIFLLPLLHASADDANSLQTYIIHLSSSVSGAQDLETWYTSFLPKSNVDGSNDQSRFVHKYRNVFAGFAARLTPDEVAEMAKIPGFLRATPQKTYSLHTTHSPNFLGLYRGVGSWAGSNYGEGTIIGVIDTGVAPNHPSFAGEDMPPPPSKWKGRCELYGSACNNKLIGARNFASNTTGPPLDELGHGTHTASTAAGNFVANASAFGQASGTASGIAPRAHLAIYKVCSVVTHKCLHADILAAMDAAIEDGVDIISISFGRWSAPFYEDGIAIGAFRAMEKGILVSCSAGNYGPSYSTLASEAPWVLTVGASTIDRVLKTSTLLGDSESYDGQTANQLQVDSELVVPLVYPGWGGDKNATFCRPGSLDRINVSGVAVLCERGGGIGRIAKGKLVKDAGGAAMILMNNESDAYSTLADAHVLPATHVSFADGEKIKAYIKSTQDPSAAVFFRGTVIGDKTAPAVTSLSSRGPNQASPGILKPDIIGPGVSIMAAFPFYVDNYTNETAPFYVISGTSVSCPHLSGVAALIKSAHPDWTPAMIKSAIMTTANQLNLDDKPIVDQTLRPADYFAIGAGHVNPAGALDPGLVYDISADDYISYLCFLYTEDQVAVIANRKIDCNGPDYTGMPEAQLNYPSFSVVLGNTDYVYSRTVTNVGEAQSSYTAVVENIQGVNVTVDPMTLNFSEKNQKLTYKVYFSRTEFTTNGSYVQGSIAWVSTTRSVRIPVIVKLVL